GSVAGAAERRPRGRPCASREAAGAGWHGPSWVPSPARPGAPQRPPPGSARPAGDVAQRRGTGGPHAPVARSPPPPPGTAAPAGDASPQPTPAAPAPPPVAPAAEPAWPPAPAGRRGPSAGPRGDPVGWPRSSAGP